MLLSWIFRGFLIVAGFVASWFVAKDAPQFGVMQMAVVLILVVVIVAVLAFWPERWSHILDRLHKPPPSN
jgi:formate hydrogenlyase subunit 3/multisubunit Na+/H+ antiporter MnhD subunit